MTKIGNMLIAQSGGPSSAINASITGAIARGMGSTKIRNVLGAVNGMQGFLDRKIINISDQMKTSEDFELLIHTPAHALGSSRYKIPKDDAETYGKIIQILKDYDIKYFFYNGGNDSMDTVNKLAAYLKKAGEDIVAVGIPKTIDNDLELTDHTPGFGSAARYVATSIAELYLDTCVYPLPAVTIVEIMGRNAGWLTAASALARETGLPAPHLIYLPEVDFDPEAFVKEVGTLLEREKQILITASEGLRLSDGKYLSDTGAAEDMFGHKTLGGAATVLEKLVKDNVDMPKLKTRAIQFSTLQRAAAHCASLTDLEESYQCGYRAVEAAVNGKTDIMITIARISDIPYVVRYDEGKLEEIANKEKKVPLSWITKGGTDVSEEMLVYLRPLVTGEAGEITREGLPKFFRFNLSKVVLPWEVK
ncbi:pyrophosphate--fructose 6-phosphate 1-phosphotransferase [Clostridia bacterium]|nr:pyrophosphate--fructose 6-phosphate 1-phosphotransferase [Clostridia bacterium]